MRRLQWPVRSCRYALATFAARKNREISEGVVLDYDAAPEYASSAYSLLLLYFAHRFATLIVVRSVAGVHP